MKNDMQTFRTSVFLLSPTHTQWKPKERNLSSVKIMEKITVHSQFFHISLIEIISKHLKEDGKQLKHN